MCLATVYNKRAETVICKNVTNIRIDDGDIVLTDIMDNETVVQGKITMANLVDGVVHIDCRE